MGSSVQAVVSVLSTHARSLCRRLPRRIAFIGDESLTNLWQRRRRRGQAVGFLCFVFILGSCSRL